MNAQINPYVYFPETAEEAFNHYASVFGSELMSVLRYKDMPMDNMQNLTEHEANKIMHIALPIGSNILMGTDMLASRGDTVDFGNGYYISVTTESRADNDKVFNALSEGGSVDMPLMDVEWGDYFGMCTDRFGVKWMISFPVNPT